MFLLSKSVQQFRNYHGGMDVNEAIWYQGLGCVRQDVHHFQGTLKGWRKTRQKVSSKTGGIYINFFIFIFIYMDRRKVDRTRIGAGLREVRAQDSCGIVGQMSHAPFLCDCHTKT